MFYEPSKNNHGLSRNPFKSCTVPRVIGWISTKNEDGSDNIAPYSQFTNLTFDPPLVLFSSNQNVIGDRKTTIKNIERTGQFVYNMVSYELREAMNRSSIFKIPNEYKDKFEYAGVTKAKSNLIDVARVAESPIQYECKYIQTIRIPANDTLATVDVIIPSLSVQKLKYKCKVPLIQNFTLLFYLFFLLCTNLYHNNLILLILLFLFSILFLVIYLTLSFLHFLVIYNIHLLSWLLLRYS